MRRRLFLQIYLTMLGIVVLFVVLVVLGWWLSRDDGSGAEFRQGIGALVAEALPPPGAPQAEIEAVLTRLGRHVEGRISVFGPEGDLLASLGEPLPAPEESSSGWRSGRGRGFAMPLPDGR